ncbi:hypothetical protein I5M32_02360 [Pedobacter sp. SD-b]|uniref:Uncharacterized protein n=1 Tax=Pedobacter segetis TaxID=2793069 RepID=A0ABS1BHF0_9SPHI|nr:hypothetical protein [Pedobacter segetis]MBK0381791.1 hypothetical protein [Pedobacter segetis]
MKLNQNEKAWVNKLVYQNVKYNETYYEVIDHVISALENEQDENITFYQKLNQIWDEDFGGYENLPYLEKQREKEVSKQINRRYRRLFLNYLKFPLILTTITLSLLFGISAVSFLSRISLFFLLLLLIAVPSIISWLMFWRLKLYDLVKPSLRDKRIFRYRDFAYRFFYILVVLPIALGHILFDYSFDIDTIYTPLFILIAVVFIIHTLSYFKLYKETFKMELAKR